MQPGHIEGNLNFTAARNGWTRNFTLTPDKVSRIDYMSLESVLELQTIKAARSNLRIFVEHPAGSGSYLKLRSWKAQDGTLQADLLQKFFEDRMLAGTVTNLDVRDAPDIVKQSVKTGDWLRAQVSVMTSSHSTRSNGEIETTGDGQEPPQETQPSSTPQTHSGFLSGFFRPAPVPLPENPPPEQADPAESEKKEEDILRERGWQPILRRLTNKKRKIKKAGEEPDIQAEGDGEEIQTPDGEEPNTIPERNNKPWRKHPFSKPKQKVKENGVHVEITQDETPPPLPVKGKLDSE